MTKKQKKVLVRICVSAVLLVILHFLPEDFPRFAWAEENGLVVGADGGEALFENGIGVDIGA